MKLVSITVASDTCEAKIGDALRSAVGWVDQCLIIHLVEPGVTDRTLEIAAEVCGDKLVVVDTPRLTGNLIHIWRNLGLDEAQRLGADWSVQLDTDERILPNGVDLRASLATIDPEIGVVSVVHVKGEGDKWRFIRHPTLSRWSQPWHEELTPTPKHCALSPVRYDELPKTEEQKTDILIGQIAAMEEQIAAEPDNPRWWIYQGSAYEALFQFDPAIKAYKEAITRQNSIDSAAWCWFRIGCCQLQANRPEPAIDACITGLRLRPDVAELPWLIALTHLNTGRFAEAAAWGRIAAAHNWSRKRAREVTRLGFKTPLALYEGPFEICAVAYQHLGDGPKQAWAEAEAKRAKKARLNFFERGVS